MTLDEELEADEKLVREMHGNRYGDAKAKIAKTAEALAEVRDDTKKPDEP